MLINISHPTSGDPLPPSLFDIYVRYKQDTRAIIAWLVSHGTRKYKGLRTVSTRDLLELAEIIQTKEVVMSDTIDFCFREAIAARTQLSKFFRKTSSPGDKDQETIQHEYFTARYTLLNLGDPKHDRKCTEKTPNRQCEDDREEVLAAASRAKATTPLLIDDPLSDVFEFYKDIQEMNDLLLATNSVWEQAARGESPLVVAAFITNVAFTTFEKTEQRLKVLCDVSDAEALRCKFMHTQENLEELGGVEVNENSQKLQQVEALQQPWQLLLQFKRVHRAGQFEETIPSMQGPMQSILRRGPDSARMDHKCLTMMLQSIRQHVRAVRQPTGIVRAGTPVYADFGYFFTHDENDTNGLR
ncbi:hypothetical protein LTR04_001942, partial [Oleoguttula sp. CCFEE 6159]